MDDTEAHFRDLQAKLTEQAQEISRLSEELLKGYSRDPGQYGGSGARDPEVKAELDRRQKKIWWLESELRKARERLSARSSRADALRLTAVRRRARRVLQRAERTYREMQQRGQS